MSVTTSGNLGPMILQSLAPALLYVPTPTMNYEQNVVLKSSLIDLDILTAA
jgi:hypothetical protein